MRVGKNPQRVDDEEDDDDEEEEDIFSTHQARYITDTMNRKSTTAPTATPYTQIFSFPSVETDACQSESRLGRDGGAPCGGILFALLNEINNNWCLVFLRAVCSDRARTAAGTRSFQAVQAGRRWARARRLRGWS